MKNLQHRLTTLEEKQKKIENELQQLREEIRKLTTPDTSAKSDSKKTSSFLKKQREARLRAKLWYLRYATTPTAKTEKQAAKIEAELQAITSDC